MGLAAKIEEVYSKKLIYQFRSEKWQKKINVKLENLIDVYGVREFEECKERCDKKQEKAYDIGHSDGYLKGKQIIKDSYKDYIRKPEGTFINRIKFLFLGKF